MNLNKIRRLSVILMITLVTTAFPAGIGGSSAVYGAVTPVSYSQHGDSVDYESPDVPKESAVPVEPENPLLPPETPEKQKQTINCASSYSIKFGQSKYISATADGGGLITYESSDTEIFEVTPYGLLIPKKIGKASLTITAAETETHKAAVKQVNVTVKSSLTKPVITVREVIEDKMSLKWDSVNGAVKYEIYRRAVDNETEYAHVGTINNAYSTSFSDPTIKQGTVYYYKVRAVAANENDYTESSGRTLCWLGTTELRTGSNPHRIQINWKRIKGASGYYIYRKISTETQWKEVKKISGSGITSYHDADCKNGKTYNYKVKAYYGDSLSAPSKQVSAYYFAAPSKVDWAVANANSRRLTWTKNSAADGYEVQYANNRLFMNARTLKISKQQSECIVTGISYKKTSFARIRAYKTVSGKKIYSSWQECKTAGAEGFATSQRLENKSKPLELRDLSGQVIGKTDTVQGGCTDGTYAYYCMYDRNKENCRIIKIRLSDKTFVKASAVLSIDHGNSITYNSKTGKLVVTYTSDHLKRMAVINPSTLVKEKEFDVDFSEGPDGRFFSSNTNMGFSSIAYNESRNAYVTVTKGTRGFAVLDSNFKIKEYIPFASRDEGYLWQNISCTDDYITVVKSPVAGSGNRYNLLAIYDWNGRFVANFNLLDKYELENVYHIGTTYYMTLFYSYYDAKGKLCRDSYVYTFDMNKENLSVKDVIEIPSKPYKLSLTNGKKQIKLKWSGISNADGYKIYYKTSKNGTYKMLKTMYGSKETTYTHKKLKAGRTYYYKVKAFTKTSGKYYYSPYTSVKSMKAKSK